eukprot:CAMPEP_0204914726 /NCGR_PEP_ID=MMETSP1397-20131031/12632_1 /ASSEMBLY_ACC=CAM_ASM_000891 /TAXON_ID=49980 /ORGANISM="Climacostomum Climacostomum virens, Strain Stock W-24" /LENGTH=58 /DNA_ID=CAMNT_0052086435 /DNA_START=325 /DNA_END=501 /DNA_ORIENTATION=-
MTPATISTTTPLANPTGAKFTSQAPSLSDESIVSSGTGLSPSSGFAVPIFSTMVKVDK